MKEILKDSLSGKPEPLGKKNQVIHFYYIDQILGHRYVADRKITIDGKFYVLKSFSNNQTLIQVNIDKDYPYVIRGFTDKTVANEYLKGIQNE